MGHEFERAFQEEARQCTIRAVAVILFGIFLTVGLATTYLANQLMSLENLNQRVGTLDEVTATNRRMIELLEESKKLDEERKEVILQRLLILETALKRSGRIHSEAVIPDVHADDHGPP